MLNKGRNLVQELKEAGIDKLSVSLNTHNKETYNQICRPVFEGAYENILDFIKKSNSIGLEIEVTAVTVSEVDVSKVKEIAEKIGAKFKVRQYIPFFW